MSGESPLVAVLLPPPEAAVAIRCCWDAGEAVLPLDPHAPGPARRRTIEALAPTHLIDGDGRRALPEVPGVPVEAGTAAVVATSGTTGEPKGVELTRSGLSASAAAVGAAVGAGPGDRWLCVLPLHYVAGLAVVGRAWAAGLEVTVHPGFDVEAIAADAGGGLSGLSVSLVPTMLRRLLVSGVDPARFRHVLLGGGAVPDDLVDTARRAGASVSATYGLTETWGGVVHDGRPLEGVEVTVADADEILVRAPMVMRRYRLAPEATAAALDDSGWLHTGDVGSYANATGVLRVVDRLGDMVKTGGVAVSPTEVERVLAGHPGVADVCVAGRPDPEWGERLVAFVVPADPTAAPSLEELRSFCRAHLPAAKAPREVVVVGAVPRTTGGKPLRRLLR